MIEHTTAARPSWFSLIDIPSDPMSIVVYVIVGGFLWVIWRNLSWD